MTQKQPNKCINAEKGTSIARTCQEVKTRIRLTNILYFAFSYA